MKYAEYQAWFHTFNTAYAALCRLNLSPNEVKFYAEEAAEFTLKKFKEVDMPEAPDMSNIDIAGLVNKMASEGIKGTGKKR